MKDGAPYRAHLESLARLGDLEAAQELDECPPLAEDFAYLWEWYLELHAGRTSNGFGLNPLTYEAIAAWAQLTGRAPAPWEVQAIKAVDANYLEQIHGQRTHNDRDKRR